MNLTLVDDPIIWNQLKPLTLNRPVSLLRLGIVTLAQKWNLIDGVSVSFAVEEYLSCKYSCKFSTDTICVKSHILPSPKLYEAIKNLAIGEALMANEVWIAARWPHETAWEQQDISNLKKIPYTSDIDTIEFPEDLFLKNGLAIRQDFELLTRGRESQEISDSYTQVYGRENIFLEEGVSLKSCILNAEEGPIYIGENAIIQEGSILIGPLSIGSNAKVGYHATLRPETTIGPNCRVAGEVKNCIFMAYSNKSHEGFLGNSIVGEWCNFGANTNASNLKNNLKQVSVYDYRKRQYRDTGLQSYGCIIGDYNKFGVSTMLNTGTVVGLSCHVFGAGFQQKYIASFSWTGGDKVETYLLGKAVAVIRATMQQKNMILEKLDEQILRTIFVHEKQV